MKIDTRVITWPGTASTSRWQCTARMCFALATSVYNVSVFVPVSILPSLLSLVCVPPTPRSMHCPLRATYTPEHSPPLGAGLMPSSLPPTLADALAGSAPVVTVTSAPCSAHVHRAATVAILPLPLTCRKRPAASWAGRRAWHPSAPAWVLPCHPGPATCRERPAPEGVYRRVQPQVARGCPPCAHPSRWCSPA